MGVKKGSNPPANTSVRSEIAVTTGKSGGRSRPSVAQMTHGDRPAHEDTVLYVIGTFPMLTTTFIDRELAALRDFGMVVRVVSIRRPAGRLSPEQLKMMDGVRYVFPIAPVRFLASVAEALATHPITILGILLRLITKEHPTSRARLKTIGHALLGVYVWWLVRKDPPSHVHAHFVDRASIVAMVVAALVGTGYSATAHANDIYVNPVLLPEKATAADFIATCTSFNARHLKELVPEANVELVYHGIDVVHYPQSPLDGSRVGKIVSVAQLKEKKGLTYLISACRELADKGISFDCDIVGDGPLRPQLQEQIRLEGLTERVRLLGSLPHDEVIQQLQAAALFVLPSVIAEDGDRDGIPNVILEAMAVGKPVVSTTVSGIPEAVVDGETGRLVPPADPVMLAEAVADLLQAPETRSDMGAAGRKRIEDLFDVRQNALKLETLLMS